MSRGGPDCATISPWSVCSFARTRDAMPHIASEHVVITITMSIFVRKSGAWSQAAGGQRGRQGRGSARRRTGLGEVATDDVQHGEGGEEEGGGGNA